MKVKKIKWKEQLPDGTEAEASTISLINIVMSLGLQQENLAGFENMRKVNRIARVLDEATDQDEISFEFKEDLKLIQDFIEKYSLALWGSREEIMEAVEEIMKVKI